jgi:hypothetical protein
MLCLVLFVSSFVITVNLYGYNDFVATVPPWLERLTLVYLLAFRSNRHIDVLSGWRIQDVVGNELRNI